ncbi:MAG: hypothetical protein MI810_15930, partial [Flavobacteriales bacterium]|nr:hypothetical protein [Flavobacteriales bacterium]
DLDGKGEEYDQMMDVNVYNDVPISKRSVNMGVPVMTSDIYSISGQGIGGVFRGHRSDIGTLYSPGNVSHNSIVDNAGEFGSSGNLYHGGFDLQLGYHDSYSGKWTKGTEMISSLEFEGANAKNPLHEPFYFKLAGEQTANDLNEWNHLNGEDPVALDLGLKVEGLSLKPRVKSNIKSNGKKLEGKDKSRPRIKRSQNIEYRTQGEIIYDEYYTVENRPDHIYEEGEFPGYSDGDPIDYENIDGTTDDVGHHIHEYSILKADGARYTYGLPAYNTKQLEAVFTNENSMFDYVDASSVTYDILDASIDNNEGVDHFFSSTELPPYVHSHMITEITSADYVDLTGNGLSEDDFGFYVKFNYQNVEGYRWREPFEDANYIKGYYSNPKDDKASYTYGEKNLHYVHSIETKTHVAVFELGDRNDGRGVTGEHHSSTTTGFGERQKYLKKIVLYSKNDPGYDTGSPTPLQTVYFEYSYELCQSIPNNDDLIMDDTDHFVDVDGDGDVDVDDNEGGKLTLKKVYITYNGNEKGRLSPYEFDYGNNRPYSKLNVDRWGNYQEPAVPNEHAINPYTRQDLDELQRNVNASAWCMDNIKLPSGGEINVEYEADDYGYVQDQRAAQMYEIYGFSTTGETSLPSSPNMYRLKKKNLRLWFKLTEDLSGTPAQKDAMVLDHIKGLDEIYFKVYEELKPTFELIPSMAKDYVAGYAKIDASSYGYDNDNLGYAYVDLEDVSYKSVGLSIFKTHPFRKAGWQYLRYQRPDLFVNQEDVDGVLSASGSALASIPLSMTTAVTEAVSISLLGYYNKANVEGYNAKMSPDKTSFVRLNSKDHLKYGGGHRTKSVKMKDNWIEGAREYGTEYSYTNEDGKTSGVADYEPLVGGEENALKKPIWYNANDQLINFQHRDAFLETPLCEAVYPAARVVYGRVVQKNLSNELVTEAQSGITVSRFYTAKDFPVREQYTELETKGFNFPLWIPYVGQSTYQNNGYSQGYSVVLNDMSGKPRSSAVYRYSDGALSKPFSKVEYYYHEDGKGNLVNKVAVLDAHGATRDAIVGVEQDFMINESENSSVSMSAGGETNADALIAPPYLLLTPSAQLNYNYSESMYRGISTNKIIYKTGILKKVTTYSDGSLVTAENHLYDAETGEALLTIVNNEWDEPVYNYNYAAHWAYDRMGGAYKNYRAVLLINGSAGSYNLLDEVGGSTLNPQDYLTLGDEIKILESGSYNSYFVTAITSSNFALEDEDGNSSFTITNLPGFVSRSGRRNQLVVKNGEVVALSPQFLSLGASPFPLFALWNSSVTGSDPQEGIDDPTYFDLNTNTTKEYDWNAGRIFLPNFYYCENDTYQNILITVPSDLSCIVFSFGNCSSKLTFTGTTPSDDGYMSGVTVDNGSGSSITSYTEQLPDFKIISQTMSGSTPISATLEHIPSGNIYTATWSDLDIAHCFESYCAHKDILHASAVTFSEDWSSSYPYTDLGDPSTASAVNISDSDINPYRYGKLGIWRTDKTHLYQESREQSGTTSDFKTQIDVDGLYTDWIPFDWSDGAANPNWDWVSEVTRYSPYGFALEERSRLTTNVSSGGGEIEIYSSQMYGYDNSLVIATSANASYFEIGYSGFEQGLAADDLSNTGHINLSSTGTIDVSDDKAHSGTNSLRLIDGESISFNAEQSTSTSEVLKGIAGKEYIVSMWVNLENSGSLGTLTIDGTSVDTDDYGEVIDGWKKLELKFTMPVSGAITITYNSTGITYVDDLRYGPYDGGMMTYVYDPQNLWLLAQLDGLNYATFYNYDEEGNLVQVKKETEKGIVTVQSSRSNTKQQTTP